mgnify:CR=1 FL=1
MTQVAIVGGGAAGLLAGIAAAWGGAQVTIYEKMRVPGKKMLITGKGRCNITNACEIPDFIKNLPGNGRFLNSALHRFTNDDIVLLLESNGLPTKVERGGRIFPVSDKAKDVVDTLVRIYTEAGGKLQTDTKVIDIMVKEGHVYGVRTVNGVYEADRVIRAAGGASYPGTGSDGGGAKLAKKLGHTIVPLKPSLIPLESDYPYVDDLQGLSLRNVQATLLADGAKLGSEFGEMLFTHFGISGPLGLSASSYIGKALEQQPLKGYLNLKPALTEEQLDARILREFEENRNKQFRNVINSLFPAKLLPVMLSLGGIDPYKQVNAVSKAERQHFEELITHFPFTVTGTRGFREAIITQGGVSVKEIRPGTMEAKKKEGLYFVGEVLDLDALTGGFNLQIAWASAHAAAEEIRAKEEQE